MVEQLDEVTIRVATEGDASGIARVHVRSWQEAYAGIVPDAYLASLDADERTAQWGRYLREGPADEIHTWVALAADRVVGFVTVGPSRDEDAAAVTGRSSPSTSTPAPGATASPGTSCGP